MKAYCAEHMLSRGRTNHNSGKRRTYLYCNHDGCNAKFRLTKKLNADAVILESAVGFEHHHVFEQVPGRGLSNEQKEIILECYARDCGAPMKVSISCRVSSKLLNFFENDYSTSTSRLLENLRGDQYWLSEITLHLYLHL